MLVQVPRPWHGTIHTGGSDAGWLSAKETLNSEWPMVTGPGNFFSMAADYIKQEPVPKTELI